MKDIKSQIILFLLGIILTTASANAETNSNHKIKQNANSTKIKPNNKATTRSLIELNDGIELAVIDHTREIVVPNVFRAGDFDIGSDGHRLIRFRVPESGFKNMKKGKCGYIDSITLNIMVPATYDECSPFIDDRAIACISCEKYCTEYPDCQNSVLLGGTTFTLNISGKVESKTKSGSVDAFCKASKSITSQESRTKFIKCEPTENNPFQMESNN